MMKDIIESNVKENCDKPNNFHSNIECSGLKVHPTSDLLVMYHYSGRFRFFSYEKNAKIKKVFDSRPFKVSCNDIAFYDDGKKFLAGYSNGAILNYDLENEKIISDNKSSKSSVLALRSNNGNVFCSSFSDSQVKVFDIRNNIDNIFVQKYDDDEIVNDFAFDENNEDVLVACTSSGFLDLFSLTKKKQKFQSDPIDSDLLCLLDIGDSLLAGCGSDEGKVLAFDKKDYSTFKNSFQIKTKSSVDVIKSLSEEKIVLGTSNGIIKVISSKTYKSLGSFPTITNGPVLGLDVTHDENFVVSLIDNTVFFWNSNMFLDLKKSKRKHKKSKNYTNITQNNNSFYNDI